MQLLKLCVVLAFVSPTLFANVEALGVRNDFDSQREVNKGIPYFNGRPYIELQNEGEDFVVTERSGMDKDYTSEVLEESFFFRTGMTSLTDNQKQRLNEIAQSLKSDSGVKSIRVLGFTDTGGSQELNQRISQQRADAVSMYLSSRGVDIKVDAKGLGELTTLSPSDARRVDLTIETEMYSE